MARKPWRGPRPFHRSPSCSAHNAGGTHNERCLSSRGVHPQGARTPAHIGEPVHLVGLRLDTQARSIATRRLSYTRYATWTAQHEHPSRKPRRTRVYHANPPTFPAR